MSCLYDEVVRQTRLEPLDRACANFVLKLSVKTNTHRNQWKQWKPPKSPIQIEKRGNQLKHRAFFTYVLLPFLNRRSGVYKTCDNFSLQTLEISANRTNSSLSYNQVSLGQPPGISMPPCCCTRVDRTRRKERCKIAHPPTTPLGYGWGAPSAAVLSKKAMGEHAICCSLW